MTDTSNRQFRVQLIDESGIAGRDVVVEASSPEDAALQLSGERLLRGNSRRHNAVLRAKVYRDSSDGTSLVRLYRPAKKLSID